jgi:hypothetical protein
MPIYVFRCGRPPLRTPAENRIWRAFYKLGWEKRQLFRCRCPGCGARKGSHQFRRCLTCRRKARARARWRYLTTTTVRSDNERAR